MQAEGMDEAAIAATSVGRGFGIRDGNGIMFVDQRRVRLPVRLPAPSRPGNVRDGRHRRPSTASIPSFTSLRDSTQFKGRCGDLPVRRSAAVARGRGPTHGPATSSRPTRSARTSRRPAQADGRRWARRSAGPAARSQRIGPGGRVPADARRRARPARRGVAGGSAARSGRSAVNGFLR